MTSSIFFRLLVCLSATATVAASVCAAPSGAPQGAKTEPNSTTGLQSGISRSAAINRLLDTQSTLSQAYLEAGVKSSTSGLAVCPTKADLLLLRGLYYYRLEEYSRSRADLERAVSLQPTQGTTDIYCVIGQCYAEGNQPVKAILFISKAIQLNSSNRTHYLRRAQAYSQAKRYNDALKDADKVVEKAPGEYWALEFRARISMNAKNYEKAVSDYSQCLKLQPNSPSVYSERAKAYDLLGKKNLAEADRKKRDSLNWNFD